MQLSKYILFIILFTVSSTVFAQNKEFDKLEMLYDQGHYRMVNRRANKLINDPTYDFSMVPTYYKSMAMFQLYQSNQRFQKKSSNLKEAEQLFMKVKSSAEGMKLIQHHLSEVSSLKRDLQAWSESLKRDGKTEIFNEVQAVIRNVFNKIPDLDSESIVNPKNEIVDNLFKNKSISETRQEILKIAKEQLGTPYLWAGNDPKGFDCSGFASYVYEKATNKTLPRKSADQFGSSSKLKDKNVRPGDLIFFDSGSGINHVGIIISQPNEPLMMIHSSTSKGIIITEIEKSEYWKSRVAGFGSYLDK